MRTPHLTVRGVICVAFLKPSISSSETTHLRLSLSSAPLDLVWYWQDISLESISGSQVTLSVPNTPDLPENEHWTKVSSADE